MLRRGSTLTAYEMLSFFEAGLVDLAHAAGAEGVQQHVRARGRGPGVLPWSRRSAWNAVRMPWLDEVLGQGRRLRRAGSA